MKFTGASITPALAAVLLLDSAPFVFADIPPNCNTVVITCPPEASVTGATGPPVESTPFPAHLTFCTYPGVPLSCVYSTTTGVLDMELSANIGCPIAASSTACATCLGGFGLDASGACTACPIDTFSPSGSASACASCPIGYSPNPSQSNCLNLTPLDCLTITWVCATSNVLGWGFVVARSGVVGNVLTCEYASPNTAQVNVDCTYDFTTGSLSTTNPTLVNSCFSSALQQCQTCNAGFGLDSINNCVPCAANEVDESGGTTCAPCESGLVPNTGQSACMLSASQAARRKTRRSAGFARKGLKSSSEVQW